MSEDIYYTVKGTGESRYTEKMSRFLAFVFPIFSAEEAKEEIKRLQNKYHDARHVCWAYVVGADGLEYQLNDNGEPSGTAGKPILGQIRSFGVTNVLVGVVRYFGGIKLGTSGLISAYREAARLALENAGKIEMRKLATIKIIFPYIGADGVMKISKQEGVRVLERIFDNTCGMTLEFPESMKDEIIGKLSKIDGVSISEK